MGEEAVFLGGAMKIHGALLTIIVLFKCWLAGGYSYEIKALRKWHPDYRCYCYWIGVCDFHDKFHKANVSQRKKIEEILPGYNAADLLVLVEDLSSINDQGRLGCGPYYINSHVGILAGLGNFCKEHMIPVQNVEFRYCRVVALGPVINNIHAHPSLFGPTKKMTLAHLVQEIEQLQWDLLLGNFDLAFRELLNQKLLLINAEMKKLNLLREPNKTIAEYLTDTTTPLNRIEMVKTLLTFDGVLIGLKFVDSTLKADYKKKIIAFGGGTHIYEAYEMLQKMGGWEPVTHDDMPASKSPSLSKSIGAAGEGHYLIKPTPISLELLEHYLKN